MSASLPRTLFVGHGHSAVCWYRAALPAAFLGMDWVGVVGDAPEPRLVTGNLQGAVGAAELLSRYEVVVLQQPRGAEWLKLVRRLQAGGTRVLYEIDDYTHAVHKRSDHQFASAFGKDHLRAVELVMRACDGMICSTDWLASRYRAFNPRVHVCRNGLDLARYELTRPEHEGVVVGWAGGTGHKEALVPWLAELAKVMEARPLTRFVSVGQRFADVFGERFGAERGYSLPFSALETYPAAMAQFDVALAPAGRSNFFRGKSDLRWLEAGALGIPTIADPVVYPDIEHGVTGFHAASPAEAREAIVALVDDPDLRLRVGAAAREHVRRERDMRVMAGQWAAVLGEVAGRPALAA